MIHELPEKLCEDFLFEIFGDITSEHLDKDTLAAIDKFFQNNLEQLQKLHDSFICIAIHLFTDWNKSKKEQVSTFVSSRTL